MAAAYNCGGSGLHCQQTMTAAYTNDVSVENDKKIDQAQC
jgi:hypothetical protein